MILDAFLQFSLAAGDSPTLVQGNPSGNEIDLHMAGIPVLANLQGARDMGIGDKPALKIVAWVTTTFTGTTGTLQAILQGAPDNGAGAAGTYVSWWLSPVYALATLVAGAKLYEMDMPRPPAGVSIPRFLRMNWTIATAVMTAGTIKSWIVLDRMDQPYQGTSNVALGGYPAGITVAN
jgi:succinate-acetate transporter protein